MFVNGLLYLTVSIVQLESASVSGTFFDEAQCESLRFKLIGGLAVRRACYGVLRCHKVHVSQAPVTAPVLHNRSLCKSFMIYYVYSILHAPIQDQQFHFGGLSYSAGYHIP